MKNRRFAVSLLMPLVLILTLWGFPAFAGIEWSLDRDSPEISEELSPADLVPACALWSTIGPNGHPTLGLLQGDNVDAFSQGDSLITQIPPVAYAGGGYYFSVTRNSVGQDRVILEQSGGNGAASDMFTVWADFGGTPSLYLGTDACDLTPGPPNDAQSDIDALTLGIISTPTDWPVYWSVDSNSSDWQSWILAAAPGQWDPVVFAYPSALGLQEGDDIDALCVDEISPRNVHFDGHDRILFSLTPSSPTLADLGLSPADVFIRKAGEGGPPRLFISHESFGLRPDDDLNALGCYRNSTAEPVPALGTSGLILLLVVIVGLSTFVLVRRSG